MSENPMTAATAPEKNAAAPITHIVAARIVKWSSAVLVILAIVLCGARQIREKIAIVRPLQFIGHSDSAAYALMGESIAEGRGIQVDYISWFFIPYSREITRREDHWPPFMGYSIAPCMLLWGETAWVAKLPAIFYGSLGLPLAAALLGYALSRRGYVALIAAFLMMAHPFMYEESLRTLSDVATAMLVATFCACVLLARRRPWMHLLAGIALAFAYYSKGSQITLLALYPVMTLLACGPAALRRRWMWLGMATAVLLMLPYWYGNWRAYGNPLHSTQNYISGYIGLADWEANTYRPYWGENLPKTSDRWTKYGDAYWAFSHQQLELVARYAMTGANVREGVWKDFGRFGVWLGTALCGKPLPGVKVNASASWFDFKPVMLWQYPAWELAAWLAAGMAVAALLGKMVAGLVRVGMAVARRRRRGVATLPESASARAERSLLFGGVLALVLVMVANALFLAYLWDVEPRFCFLFLPLIAALGATALSRIIEQPFRWGAVGVRRLLAARRFDWRLAFPFRHGAAIASLIAAFLVIAWAPRADASMNAWIAPHVNTNRYPFADELRYPRAGQWLADHAPNAVIMCRDPWELKFYCAKTNKTVALPYFTGEHAAEAIKILRYYKVTDILMDNPRAIALLKALMPGKKIPSAAPERIVHLQSWMQRGGEARTAPGKTD